MIDGTMQKNFNYCTYCLKILKIESKNVTTNVSALVAPFRKSKISLMSVLEEGKGGDRPLYKWCDVMLVYLIDIS